MTNTKRNVLLGLLTVVLVGIAVIVIMLVTKPAEPADDGFAVITEATATAVTTTAVTTTDEFLNVNDKIEINAETTTADTTKEVTATAATTAVTTTAPTDTVTDVSTVPVTTVTTTKKAAETTVYVPLVTQTLSPVPEIPVDFVDGEKVTYVTEAPTAVTEPPMTTPKAGMYEDGFITEMNGQKYMWSEFLGWGEYGDGGSIEYIHIEPTDETIPIKFGS